MEEPEQGLSPTKPKNPFRKEVWLHARVGMDRQISVEVQKRCEALLHQAMGKVQLSYPSASAESKNLLHRTCEDIMQGLDKASRLRVLDPVVLEKHSENYKSVLQQTKRKREELELCNKKGREWYEELRRQYGPENELEYSGESAVY